MISKNMCLEQVAAAESLKSKLTIADVFIQTQRWFKLQIFGKILMLKQLIQLQRENYFLFFKT